MANNVDDHCQIILKVTKTGVTFRIIWHKVVNNIWHSASLGQYGVTGAGSTSALSSSIGTNNLQNRRDESGTSMVVWVTQHLPDNLDGRCQIILKVT